MSDLTKEERAALRVAHDWVSDEAPVIDLNLGNDVDTMYALYVDADIVVKLSYKALRSALEKLGIEKAEFLKEPDPESDEPEEN